MNATTTNKRVFRHMKSGNFFIEFGGKGMNGRGEFTVQSLKAGKGFGPLRSIHTDKLEEVPAEWFLKF